MGIFFHPPEAGRQAEMEDGKMKNYTVYKAEEAGSPESHEAGKWYFQPDDYDDGSVFSNGYNSEQAAKEAAEEWESEPIWEN